MGNKKNKFFNLVSSKEENNFNQAMAPSNQNSNNYDNGQNETFVYNSYNNQTNNINEQHNQQYNQYSQSNQVNQNYQNNQVYQNNQNYQNNYQYNQVNNQQVQSNISNQVVQEYADNEVLDMPEPKEVEYDPLNNGSNPVPVNPVADVVQLSADEELPKNVKANIFSVIGMIIGMILTPGTTMMNNSKKYRSFTKSLMITFWITFVTLILCVAVRIVVGAFNKTYNSITGATSINFDFSNILRFDNYAEYLIIALIVSVGAILVIALVYYASSFFNSKGVPFGSYLMISNLAILPFIIGVVVLFPIGNLISTYLGALILTFFFIYTLISLIIGINEILVFKNINRKILYNTLNITFILLVMMVIVVTLIRINVLMLPEINI